MIRKDFDIHSSDGIRLYLHTWQSPQPNKVMVIVHGMGGHANYYNDSLADYMHDKNMSIYAPDLRGHGKSEGKRGDIDDFNMFLEDVKVAVKFARDQHPTLPLVLLGESMGTPIAVNYAATAQGSLRPDALALLACVVAPTIKPRVDEILRTAFYLAVNRKKPAIPITGREEEGIRDREFIKILKSDPLFNRFVSVRFLLDFAKFTSRAFNSAEQLSMPTIVMLGGKDITVRPRSTKKFFDRISNKDKEWYVFPDIFHSILNDPEGDLVRAQLAQWLDHITTEKQLNSYVKV